MPPPSTTRLQKALLLGTGVLLAIVLCEAALQLASGVFREQRQSRRAGPAHEPVDDAYRILAIGESTTARFFGVAPYTYYLERALNRDPDVRFQVFNAGEPGVHTAHLLEKLPKLLEEHDPHMVIAMMGINDYLYFDDVVPSAVQALGRSRLLRLLVLLGERLEVLSGWGEPEEIEPGQLARFQALLDRLGEPPGAEELERALRAALEAARAAQTRDRDDGLWSLPAPYRPAYRALYGRLSEVYVASGREQEALALWRDAIERHPDVEFFERQLAAHHRRTGQHDRARAHERRADELADRLVLRITRENYRKLARMLESRGVELVAMQYPLRSVDRLRALLDPASDVTFVDNAASFRRAVLRHGYDEVFGDRFAGDFGHCTRRGNRLIARNVLEQVFVPRLAGAGSRWKPPMAPALPAAPPGPAPVRQGPGPG